MTGQIKEKFILFILGPIATYDPFTEESISVPEEVSQGQGVYFRAQIDQGTLEP